MSPVKNLIFCVTTLCFTLGTILELQAQQSSTKKWVTIHNHTDITQHYNYMINQSGSVIESFEKEDINYINLGVGYRIMNEKNRFQEFSLIQLTFHKDDQIKLLEVDGSQVQEPGSGNLTKEVNLRLRWAYGMYFSLNNSDKIKPGISVGVDPVWNYYRDTPKTSAGFPLTFHQVGFDLRIIPATTFQLSSRLQLQLAFPVGLLVNRWNFSKLENPILTEELRSQSSFESELGFNNMQIQLGVGVEL